MTQTQSEDDMIGDIPTASFGRDLYTPRNKTDGKILIVTREDGDDVYTFCIGRTDDTEKGVGKARWMLKSSLQTNYKSNRFTLYALRPSVPSIKVRHGDSVYYAVKEQAPRASSPEEVRAEPRSVEGPSQIQDVVNELQVIRGLLKRIAERLPETPRAEV